MFSVEELRFAQKYPFSALAKRVVKEIDFSLEKIPQPVLDRARIIVLSAFRGKTYDPTIGSSSASILKDEILAFPVAKILVSLQKNDESVYRFCEMVSKSVFSRLEKESNDVVFELAWGVGVKFFLEDGKDIFASVPLPVFLGVDSSNNFFKLVNQRVSAGKIFLSKNEFLRFVSFKVQKNLLDSLPVDVSGVPKNLKSIAKEISVQVFESKKARFDGGPLGDIKPEFFPPCIERLYSEILAGKNLNHMERFSLATFMLSIGMPVEQVINLYSHTPNFDKKVTAYQVTRLAGKGGTKYSAAGCSKMGEYKVRVPSCPCNANKKIKHPVQVYRGGVFGKNNSRS